MSKTIEEIKEEVAREFLSPFRTWLENSRFSNDDNISVLEDSGAIDEVVKRYAQSKTQELKEQNTELVFVLQNIVNMLEVDAKISVESIKRILTKYNHLKSNTNESNN